MRVWDLRSKSVIRKYECQGGGMNAIQFVPDGTCVAAGVTDSSIRVWDIRTDTLLQLYKQHDGAVTGTFILRCLFSVLDSSDRTEVSSEW